jgi:hypothetical protein
VNRFPGVDVATAAFADVVAGRMVVAGNVVIAGRVVDAGNVAVAGRSVDAGNVAVAGRVVVAFADSVVVAVVVAGRVAADPVVVIVVDDRFSADGDCVGGDVEVVESSSASAALQSCKTCPTHIKMTTTHAAGVVLPHRITQRRPVGR